MNRCSNCMSIGVIQGICPYCGYDNSRQNGAHQLPVGTILNGQYTVGRVLGQGGFGITYKGWDNFLDIPVAIKEYFPTSYVNRTCSQSYEVRSYGGDVEARFEHNKRRFQKEVKALAKFSDIKEIVQVKNFFFANNTAYIVMQFVNGIELKDYISRRGGRLSMDETKNILEPVVRAIAMVHKEGLIHRDISPDNIMLLPDGSVKLLDFGAVRDVGAGASDSGMMKSTSTEAIVKHGFAPIEQYVNNGNTGTWTDVYALCATIYYCLTGRVPTDAASRMMGETLPWFGELGLDVPARDEAAIKHGMELHIEKRTQTMGELHTELYYPSEEARRLREEQERERLRLEREQAELRRRNELAAQAEAKRLKDEEARRFREQKKAQKEAEQAEKARIKQEKATQRKENVRACRDALNSKNARQNTSANDDSASERLGTDAHDVESNVSDISKQDNDEIGGSKYSSKRAKLKRFLRTTGIVLLSLAVLSCAAFIWWKSSRDKSFDLLKNRDYYVDFWHISDEERDSRISELALKNPDETFRLNFLETVIVEDSTGEFKVIAANSSSYDDKLVLYDMFTEKYLFTMEGFKGWTYVDNTNNFDFDLSNITEKSSFFDDKTIKVIGSCWYVDYFISNYLDQFQDRDRVLYQYPSDEYYDMYSDDETSYSIILSVKELAQHYVTRIPLENQVKSSELDSGDEWTYKEVDYYTDFWNISAAEKKSRVSEMILENPDKVYRMSDVYTIVLKDENSTYTVLPAYCLYGDENYEFFDLFSETSLFRIKTDDFQGLARIDDSYYYDISAVKDDIVKSAYLNGKELDGIGICFGMNYFASDYLVRFMENEGVCYQYPDDGYWTCIYPETVYNTELFLTVKEIAMQYVQTVPERNRK